VRLIEAAATPMHRTILVLLYATGARRAEVARIRLCTQAREVGAHRMDLNFIVTSSTSVSHLMQRQ
jgi:integrase